MAQPLLPDLLIEGYRGLRRLELKKLGNVNLIVGQNGVGKTSVLEAVRLYVAHANAEVLSDVLESRGDREQLDDSFQPFAISELYSLFHGMQSAGAAPTPIRIGTSAEPREISFVWVRRVLDSLGNYQHQFDADNATEFTEGSLPALLVRQAGLNLRLLTLARVPVFGVPRNDFKQGGAKVQDKLAFVGSHGVDEDEFGPYWDTVLAAGLDDDVTSALRSLNPSILKIWMQGGEGRAPRRAVARLRAVAEPVPVRRLGEGMYRLLAIASAIVHAKNGFLLIDEFENGLHYKTQDALWKFVIRTARELKVQVFATTHSRDCIGAFGRAAEEDKEFDGVLTKLERAGDEIVAKQLYEDDIVLASENLVEIR